MLEDGDGTVSAFAAYGRSIGRAIVRDNERRSSSWAHERATFRRVSLRATRPPTPRERDVLAVARSGATVAEIATNLYLSEGTVRNYLSSAIAKTAARSRIDALRIADERGWL